MFIALATDFIN